MNNPVSYHPTNAMHRVQFSFCCVISVLACTTVLAHGPVHEQVDSVTRAIKQSPQDAQLYMKRGELFRLEQHWDLAMADFEKARTLATNQVVIDLALGRLFLEAGWPFSAKVVVDRFVEAQPKHSDGLALRAQIWIALSKPLEAATDYSRAIDCASSPVPELYIARANALVEGGEDHWEDALQGLEEGVKKLGSLVTLELPAIEIELRMNRFNSALKRLDKLTAESPRKESWLQRRGDILVQADRPAEAKVAYQDALQSLRRLPASRRNVPAMLELEKLLITRLKSLNGRSPDSGSQ